MAYFMVWRKENSTANSLALMMGHVCRIDQIQELYHVSEFPQGLSLKVTTLMRPLCPLLSEGGTENTVLSRIQGY